MNNIQFDQALYKKLTEREKQVASFAKEGLNCKDTADRLGVKYSTIGSMRSRIMKKVGCKNMTAAVVSLINAGIL
jgi:DNA-binding NarL/FixJ family response regulator